MKFSFKIVIFFVFLIGTVLFNTANAQNFERISNKEGFNQNTINVIEQDQYGYLWYGTPNGLIRYDGYEFKAYTTQSKSEGNISSNYILSLKNDDQGVLWIGSNVGLNIYVPWLEKFYTVPLPNKLIVNEIQIGPNGRVWILGNNHLYTCEILDIEKGIFNVSKNILKSQIEDLEINAISFIGKHTLIVGTSRGLKKIELKSQDDCIEIDSITSFENFEGKHVSTILKTENNFLIGTFEGLYKVSIDGGVAHILNDFSSFDNNKLSYSKLQVNNIIEDHSGVIWIATTNNGLFKYDQDKNIIEHFAYNTKDELGLSSKMINALYQDDFNVLWIGTAQGGINKLDLTQKPFISYSNNPFNTNSLSDNLIMDIVEDTNGRLWLSGFNDPLFRSVNRVNEGNITKLKFEDLQDRINIGADDVIRCIYEDRHGYLWFGSDQSLTIYNPKEDQFKKVVLMDQDEPLTSTSVRDIIQIDDNNIVLVGELILVLTDPWEDIKAEKTPHIVVSSALNLGHERAQTVLVDDNFNIWFGTTKGLLQGVLNNNQIEIKNEYNDDKLDEISLSYNNVFSLHYEENNLWIGTFGGGLNKMTLNDEGEPLKMEYYRKNDILPDDAIYGILQDDNSNLWLSTDMGLVKFNMDTNKIHVYDVRDGLNHNNFRQNASFKGKSGYFYFGGLNGLTAFKPQDIKENSQTPEILISALLLNNKRINIGEKINGKVLLEKSISETEHIEISQDERIISFNLSVKHTTSPSKNKLEYKLEGFKDDWTVVQAGKTTVTYTNLSAGNYVFKIRGANGDGMWSEKVKELKVKILPPWYQTWLSYSLFAILVLGIVSGVMIYFLQHERLKQGLKYEKMDKERMETINQGKFRYFTNLSHEFRTPLTLIAGPLESIIANNSDSKNSKYLSIIEKNTKRLLSLVDQLITFRQAEQGHIKLNLVKTTLGEFIYPTTEAFENYALEKNINFFYKVNDPNEEIIIDVEKFERIIFNLLSNSFKNTPSQGNISIEAEILVSSGENIISVDVVDTGKGIPPEDMENIFERFYQLGNKDVISGGGIGLSFCKSLVHILGGNIFAKSNPGKETRFSVRIPSKNIDDYSSEIIKNSNSSFIKNWVPLSNTIIENDIKTDRIGEQKEFSILIVEDEADVQNFLYNEFSIKYNVSIANNGIEALDKIKIKAPDLIISDVMMPGMDGYELCEKLKSSSDTCHLPVLLLTALGSNEEIIKGLEYGADEYLSKPFSIKHLELRVNKLIKNSIQIKQYFSKNSTLPKSDKKLELCTKDQEFIENLNKVIEKNLSDSSFGVEELSKEIGLSTSHFYRRLKQLTGQVPNAFLRNYRLQHAAELLKSNEGYNVAEVMYQIGIESNSYFSTSFKKLHGVSPSEYLKKNT
ncbi:histidine kinase [Formosa agariphila KMM 3901]|uniref:histidine kinase n=1 Tax=Formosa agariphila (strain DSM 15362 / KCTC 12365 / LMG 23005 / KMM 3901 / M-2Alg 35-1) TaxID=1347342 RepID=T2KMF0_FORAG|nr:two-component regulator propeller domain-containing protein [Formosa agariphila]CDF79638.1 histidine kinase [Formosa agariphila KMM 3901]